VTVCIAFDLDGTLIDSAGHIHGVVSSALSELELPGLSRDTLQGFVGNGLAVLIDRVVAHVGAPPEVRERLHSRTLHHYVETPTDPASVYPGVHRALTALAGAGHRLTICTNKPGPATVAALRDAGLQDHFDAYVAGDSLSTRKPHPAMLEAALGGARPGLFVGDSEVDAETAERAGVPFLLFTEGYRKSPVDSLPHAAAFSAFADLPALVTDQLARLGHDT
jgi:phosphoglycolate phosphatase